jgi:hypothetical protein
MTVARLRVELTDPAMGAGVATHFFTGFTLDAQEALVAFWTSLATKMAGQCTIRVPNVADVLDEATGEMLSSTVQGSPATLTGGGTGAYVGGVGAAITWDTAGIVAGRRVRGRTFVVPLGAGSGDTDGTISTAVVTALSTAATALITDAGSDLVVWSRPRAALPGTVHPVVAARVSDRTAWLQSRKR